MRRNNRQSINQLFWRKERRNEAFVAKKEKRKKEEKAETELW